MLIEVNPQRAPSRTSSAASPLLRQLGIEADLILFHPYDRWGFAELGKAVDVRYVRYVGLDYDYGAVCAKRRDHKARHPMRRCSDGARMFGA